MARTDSPIRISDHHSMVLPPGFFEAWHTYAASYDEGEPAPCVAEFLHSIQDMDDLLMQFGV